MTPLRIVGLLVVLALVPAELRADDDPQKGSDDVAHAQSAMNYADAATASVTSGLKLLLSNTDLSGDDTSLEFELNLVNLWKPATDVSELTEQYEDVWFNPRSLTIVGSASPLVDAGDRTGEIDTWSLGFKWAIRDPTSLFRPDTADALIRGAAANVKKRGELYRVWAPNNREVFWASNADGVRDDAGELYDEICGVDKYEETEWDSLGGGSNLWKNLNDACSRPNNKTNFSNAMSALIKDTVANIDCSMSTPFTVQNVGVPKFKHDSLNAAWVATCKPTVAYVDAKVAKWKKDKNNLKDEVKKRAKGWVVSLEGRWTGDTEVSPVEGGAEDEMRVSREHSSYFKLDTSYQRKWRTWTLAAQAVVEGAPRRWNIAIDAIEGNLSASSSPVGWAGAQGLVGELGVKLRRDDDTDTGDRDTEPYEFTQRIALPLKDKVFLQFDIREAKIKQRGWDIRPTFSIIWTYENDEGGDGVNKIAY